MADLKISQFTPVTDPTDVTLAGYKGLDNVKLSADVFATDADISAVSDEVATLTQQVDSIDSEVNTIQEVIPNTASAANQLVDRDTMNSTVSSLAANYVTYTANGDAFPTLNDLLTATTVYHGGVAYMPTAKDYATVLVDPTAPAPFTNGTVRRTYDGAVWAYSYGINEQPLTADQIAALGSGITAAKVAQYDSYAVGKQNILTPGDNITIDNTNPAAPIISASGGGSGDFVDKMTFINTMRTIVGATRHLVNSNAYIILDDGLMQGISTTSYANLVPDVNGDILVNGARVAVTRVRGVRILGVNNLVAPNGFLSGISYEHFAVTIQKSGFPINLANNVDYLCDNGLEWLNLNGQRFGITGFNNRAFSELPNLSTILVSAANTLFNVSGSDFTPSLPIDRSFINVKNTPECKVYAPTIEDAQRVVNSYPGLSNWTPLVLSPAI